MTDTLLRHILRVMPTTRPLRTGEWATLLAPEFTGGDETMVVRQLRQLMDDGVITRRGNQHRSAPHTLRLSQTGMGMRAQMLLNERKERD